MQQLPNAQFIFHNAGQGLFYSGNVNGFEFIYDCGSDRKQHLNDIVLNYKSNLPTKVVNLLILSHLHEDHVSGLKKLFTRNPKVLVERVILPYLSPIERLILAIKASVSAYVTGDWYYAFLSDPVQFFMERGVERITFLGGSEPEQTKHLDRRDNKESDRFIDNEKSDKFTDKLKDSTALREVVLHNEPHLRDFLAQGLKIKSHDGAIIISVNSIFWQFRFFNYNVKPEVLKPFSDFVKSTFNGEKISKIITDEQKRERLRNCYKSLVKTDFNNTSLLVLHGPTHTPNNYSQLLTGDINLKKHVSEITGHFGRSLSDVSLSLIPHHGSKNNWDSSILPFLSNSCRWVVSTGKTNKTQPCSDILDDIKRHGHAFSVCDDDSKLTFDASHNLHIYATIP